LSPASGAGYLSEPRLISQDGKAARSRVRADQCVCAVAAVGVLGFYLDGRQSELTKPTPMNPAKTVQGTSRLSLSAITRT
jgi:hypothetical protein